LTENVAQTLFDKYGGVPVVTEIVRDFYKRVMRRPNLRRYFVNVPLENVIHHQIAFVSMVMGKTPHDYSGRSMKEAHRGIGVTTASFELAAELLSDTLVAAEVEQADIDAIMAKVASLRADIVER
jgi:hemoglobin